MRWEAIKVSIILLLVTTAFCNLNIMMSMRLSETKETEVIKLVIVTAASNEKHSVVQLPASPKIRCTHLPISHSSTEFALSYWISFPLSFQSADIGTSLVNLLLLKVLYVSHLWLLFRLFCTSLLFYPIISRHFLLQVEIIFSPLSSSSGGVHMLYVRLLSMHQSQVRIIRTSSYALLNRW